MTIIKTILEIENEAQETELIEADILIVNKTSQDIQKLLDEDITTLADLISDETGFCVNEIIGYKEPEYIIDL